VAAAKTENNKNTGTVTAPAPIAENRNMLFVILFRMRQYFMFLIIHIYTYSVISKMSGLCSEFRKLFGDINHLIHISSYREKGVGKYYPYTFY
jgi:hypothetical protein